MRIVVVEDEMCIREGSGKAAGKNRSELYR